MSEKQLPEWMKEPTFTLPEVGEIVDARPATLWQQIQRGAFPFISRLGSGNEIQLSGEDVIRIVAVRDLGRSVGGSMKLTGNAARQIKARTREALTKPPGRKPLWLHRSPAGDWDVWADNLPKLPIYSRAALDIEALALDVFQKLESVIANRGKSR